jgi:hypothetical protein
MRKILWFLLIAMVLALPAPALGAQDDPFANAQDSTDLAPSGATDQPFPSPHLCRGQSNLPHRSTHNPANVNGEARTYCRAGAVSYLWAQAQLWEKRWWGWDKVGTPVSNSTSNRTTVSAFDATACRNNDWRTTGKHVVTDNGHPYSGETASNGNRVTC